MSDEHPRVTWDGKAISPDPPFGATVVVFRRQPALSILLLHRAHHGAEYEGDWAWTPPAGARQPGEAVADAAERELYEEAGLRVPITACAASATEWAVFLAEVGDREMIRLIDPEHDRFAWVSPGEALRRVAPEVARETLAKALACIDATMKESE
ncbi:NUDIX domain-containing protein [Sulfobacillus harzensis]|uniref:NUDIX hydrolase n=1 Tax=Sulfobacillus harzensis TaxID=2729629 RepID=A0A7Y0L6M9_9FIRM|nr:NUDIX hydrolase [Sulfobacillus harzensis]NMP24216.1 NUDIX hydrolase [Sulfobacillus harzensis]